jgi:hypothetical protein
MKMSKLENMKRLTKSRLVIAMVTSIATAAVVFSGMSAASIPDGSGVIHGCYATSGTNHTLKVIDSAVTSKCPAGYKSLDWNQTGSQGPPGPPGLARDVGSVNAGASPTFQSEGLTGWKTSITHPATGTYCLTPDSSSTMANSALVVSDGSGAAFGAGTSVMAFWGGYCSESPVIFRVQTSVDGSPSDAVDFTAIVP